MRPHDDVEIKVTGLRPGEKLAETLTSPVESSTPCYDELLHSIEPVRLGRASLDAALGELEQLAINDDHAGAKVALLALTHVTTVDDRADPESPLRTV
jgi:FlaA1/EpsC-like NDP-sugar epimerase